MRLFSRIASALAAACVVASCSPPLTVLLELRDPGEVLVGASDLVFEVRTAEGDWVNDYPRSIPGSFPATIVVSSSRVGEFEVTATAYDDAGEPVARARTISRLSENTSTATLIFGPACDTDCDDGLFCNGEERCERGICIRELAPCQANFECVESTCSEENDTCSTTVDQSVCDLGDGVSRYCNPNSGCVEGAPCTTDAECQDTSVCNGTERCIDFRCSGGSPPSSDDGSPCTIDGCNDANSTDPIFHVQDPSKDGNACDMDDGRVGICLSTDSEVCVESVCGDGFVDPFREPCDDGNEENSDGCTRVQSSDGQSICTGAFCGDGFVHQGVEACDDGNNFDGDGCRRDCSKIEVCGDGILDTGEACDDGNSNPNDGCDACRTMTWKASVLTGLGPTAGDAKRLTNLGVVSFDRVGNLFLSTGWQIWRVDGETQTAVVIAGSGERGYSGDNGPATSAKLEYVTDLAVDGLGNVFFSDGGNHRIRQICAGDGQCPAGFIRTIAGTGVPGFSGDGGSAINAQIAFPQGIAVDGLGNVYFVDRRNDRVRKICAGDDDCGAGEIRTIAGTDAFPGDPNEGAQATDVRIYPEYLALGPKGDLYFTETFSHIRKLCMGRSGCATGTLQTVAGGVGTGFSGDGGPATEARTAFLKHLTVDSAGNIFFADTSNYRIRQVCAGDATCPPGNIQTVAGSGGDLNSDYSGDGPALEIVTGPLRDLAIGPEGHVFFISDARLREICTGSDSCAAGFVRTVAGAGTLRLLSPEGRATSEPLAPRWGQMDFDRDGSLLLNDRSNHRLMRVCLESSAECPVGEFRSVLGTGLPGFSADGEIAQNALTDWPGGVAVDTHGNVYFSDDAYLRRVCAGDASCPAGTLQTVAGNGVIGYPRDGSLAVNTNIVPPTAIVVDELDNIFFSTSYAIFKICSGADCSAGTIHTVAGNGTSGFSGDGGPATAARLGRARGLHVDHDGNIFIADEYNHRIRKVCAGDAHCAAGTIETVAGNGTQGFSGDGGPAIDAELNVPHGIATDRHGNIFIADRLNNRIRKVCAGDAACPAGTIHTIAGNGETVFSGDGGPATEATVYSPYDVAVDAADNVYALSSPHVRMICAGDARCPAGTIKSVAGSVHPGDGRLSRAAFTTPSALVSFGSEWLVADGVSNRVRLVDEADDQLNTVVGYQNGLVDDEPVSARYSRLLHNPRGIAVDAAGSRFFVSESEGHTIRMVDTRAEPWMVSTYAGTGVASFADGDVSTAAFSAPMGLLFDETKSRLLVADRDNHVIRSIDLTSGETSTLVGTPRSRGFFGDGGAASEALLNQPQALALGPDGSIYFADTGNHRVRRIDPGGTIDSVVGDGTAASSGEGAMARLFPINSPQGLSIDAYGNLFASSSTTVRFVAAGDDGKATGDDPVQTIYGRAPRTSFPQSVTNCLSGVAVTDGPNGEVSARVLVLDACVGFVIALERSF